MIDYTKKIKSEIFAILALTVCALVLAIVIYYPKDITLVVDDSVSHKEMKLSTSARTVGELIDSFTLDISKNDRITYDYMGNVGHDLNEKIRSGMTVTCDKAFDIFIKADGKTFKINSPAITCISAIEKAGIALKDEDITIPKRNHTLKKGENIVVKRVEIKDVTKDVEIKYSTKVINTSDIGIGQVKVLKQGKNGKGIKYYHKYYVNKRFFKKKMYKEKVLKKPTTKVIAYGTKIDFRKCPVNYRKVLDVKATAYHCAGTAYGASGNPCRYGTIAVDRKVIPLGTKCYIEGYGYAIANDTGGAIKGNIIDLYMSSDYQVSLWGVRNTKIYILK